MKYRRLPGIKRNFFSWRSLWMGDDHLLAVNSKGYAEDYTRYYFKDIKAVVVRRTARGRIWNGILAAALGLCLFAFVMYGFYPSGALAVAVVLATPLLVVGLFVNIVLGPTCCCHIQVPLGIHELPSLRRIRTVRKVLDRIRPFVVERQGTIVPEDAFARSVSPADEPLPMSVATMPQTMAPLPRDVASLPGTVPGGGITEASRYRGSAHYAAFSLLIVQAFLGVTALEYHGAPFLIMYGFLTLGLFICLVTAVVKQYSHPVPRPVRRLVWAALLAVTCAIPVGYYVGVFLNVLKANANANPEMDMKGIVAVITANPVFPFCIVFFSAYCAILGALGLFSYLRDKEVFGDAGRKNGVVPTRDLAP
jgi:hypothetical protein